MSTQKQITANQQNAQLSTGAITAEGKSIVAQNAVKHGIFTKDLIIATGNHKENMQDYQELLNNLITSLEPNGQLEHVLVEKIAIDCWRIKRVLRFESGCIRKVNDKPFPDPFDGGNEDARSLPEYYEAEKALRYDRSLHKSIMQNILMLKKLQGIL
jgi:hypothetical protein